METWFIGLGVLILPCLIWFILAVVFFQYFKVHIQAQISIALFLAFAPFAIGQMIIFIRNL